MSIDSVPFDHPWDEVLIGHMAEVIVGGTPSTSVPSFWGGSIPWMVSGDIHLKRIADVTGRITEHGLNSSNAKLVAPPAVAIALAGQGKTRGTVALTLAPLTTNQSVALIRPTSERLDAEYLYYALGFRYEELRSRSSGEGRAGLSKGLLEQIPVPVPPPEQQTAIADILSTVDRAIEQTEALIAKQRRIKAGLLHDLLTRGIDEHGHLRDPSTHRFKPSPVGLVPEEWEYDQFGSLVEHNVFGPRFSAALYSENGNAAMLRTTDLDDEGNITSAELPRANLDTVRFSAHFLQYGDLVVSRSGTVGVTTVFAGYEVPVVPAAFMIRFRLSKDAKPDYFRLLFNAPNGRRLIHSNMAGGVQSNITGTAMMRMSLPIPPRVEQDRICAVLASADLVLRSTELEAEKLRSVKAGLMQDLLSGRVSVVGLIADAPLTSGEHCASENAL